MPLKRKVLFTIFGTVGLTTLVTILIIFYIFDRNLSSHIAEEYNRIYEAYTRILQHEEKELSWVGTASVQIFLRSTCKDTKGYFLTLPEGTVFGVEKQTKDGCLLLGEPIGELMEMVKVASDLDYVVLIYKEWLDLKGEDLDAYMKDKVVTDSIIIERLSDERFATYPLDLKGWTVYGSLLQGKVLMIELPMRFWDANPRGKIVILKDINNLYVEAYTTAGFIILFALLSSLLASFVLYKTASYLVDNIHALKVSAEHIEKGDFSHIDGLRVKEGKDDEISKLKASFYRMASKIRDLILELESKNKELEELAYFDPLTGLPNRRFFLNSVQTLLESARRYGNPLSLMVMDVDNFKSINDTYGHEAGDLVLKSLASILKTNLRQADIPARFGGEEFIVALPNTSLESAYKTAERIRKTFENSTVIHNGREIKTTISIGVAQFRDYMESIDDLIRDADQALYQAKATGKNRVVIYEPQGGEHQSEG